MEIQGREKIEVNVKQDIALKGKHIFDDFYNFTDGVRTMFLIHRPKEGGKNNGKAFVKKVVTANSEEFYVQLLKLLDEKERADMPYRIYSSLNARDIEKAIRQFKFEQLEADYYDDESRHNFYYDVRNRFI